MNTAIHIDGKTIPFTILPVDGKGFEITIGGRTFCTAVVKNGQNLVTVDVNGCEIELGIDGELKDESLQVERDFSQVEVRTDFLSDLSDLTKALKKKEALRKSQTDAHECKDLNGAVLASMPGKVVSIIAKVGEAIEENQVVCTLEAMKMQNEITAPLKGRIAEICCNTGDLVEKGEILFRIT